MSRNNDNTPDKDLRHQDRKQKTNSTACFKEAGIDGSTVTLKLLEGG